MRVFTVMRGVAWAIVAVACGMAAGAVAQQQDGAEPLRQVYFDGDELSDALDALSTATGINIIVSPKATDKVTAFFQDIPSIQALEELVKVSGLYSHREGNTMWVLTRDEYFDNFNLGRERRVISLNFAEPLEIASVLDGLKSRDGVVIAYPAGNSIVIADEPERVAYIQQIVAELDIPESALTTRVLQLNFASAQDMVALVTPISRCQLTADIRTNQIVARGAPEEVDKVATLLRDFDKPDLVETRTFFLQYANADLVAELLREVITGRKQNAPGTGVVGGQPSSEPPKVFTAAPSAIGGGRPLASNRSSALGGARDAGGPTATIESVAQSNQPDPMTLSFDEFGGGEEPALGPLASVSADTRTNAVIVTHTTGVLDRLEQVIHSIDIPNEFHRYQFLNINPVDLDVESKLLGLLPRENAYLNVDPIGRAVTFRASEHNADQIMGLLASWDNVVRQVRIEAEIMSVNVSLVKELGISWQAVLEDANDIVNGGTVNINFPPALGSTANQGVLRIGELATDDYTAAIQALATDSDTQSIASPHILTKDGAEAQFTSARDEPYTVVTVDGNTQTTLQDVRFLNVGVTLSVVPTINTEDLVSIQVGLEISDLVEFRNGVPVADRSTTQTDVTIHDGHAVLLGGLRQRARGDVEQGVPGLRKIPLLGNLFKNKRKDDSEFEIVLVLRPFIVGEEHAYERDIEDMHSELEGLLRTRPFITERRHADEPFVEIAPDLAPEPDGPQKNFNQRP